MRRMPKDIHESCVSHLAHARQLRETAQERRDNGGVPDDAIAEYLDAEADTIFATVTAAARRFA